MIPRHDPINAIIMGAIARDAGLTPAIPRSALNAWPGAIWCCGRWSSIRQAYLLAEPELDCDGEHRDPFDRLLVCKSRTEPMLLLTVDRQLSLYGTTVQRVG